MIHPLWIICLLVRVLIAINLHRIPIMVPLLIGAGFIFKGLTGSNDETQIAKVFWHDTRYFHGVMYLLAAYYMYTGKIKIAKMILFLDIIFSIFYRMF